MSIKGALFAAAPCGCAANKKYLFIWKIFFITHILFSFLMADVWPLKCLKVLSRRSFTCITYSSFCSNSILVWFFF